MEQVHNLLQQTAQQTQPSQMGSSSGSSSFLGGSGPSTSQGGIFSGSQGMGGSSTSAGFQNRFQNILNLLQQIGRNLVENLRIYVNQYPPLAAFLFTIMAFSAVPITIFLLFAGTSIAITLSTALIGFSLVEGTLLMLGGGLLAVFLGGVTLFTSIGFTWLLGIWIAYRGIQFLYQRMSGTSSSIGESVTGSLRNLGQQVSGIAQNVAGQMSGQQSYQPSGMYGQQQQQQQPSYGGSSGTSIFGTTPSGVPSTSR